MEIFSETTPDLKRFAEKIKMFANNQNHDQDEISSIEQEIDIYLLRHREINEIDRLIRSVIDEMKKQPFPESWLYKYYTIASPDKGRFNDYYEDATILRFLNQRYKDEHLYIELDTDKQREETLFGILFIYSRTYFYTLQCAKQYIHNGTQGYIVNDKTKLIYKKLEYIDFNIKDWNAFQTAKLEEYKRFVEESLIRFIKK